MNSLDIAVRFGALGVAAWVVRANLWRALLCVWPSSMRLEVDAPADQLQVPLGLTKLAAEVTALGFLPLGTHLEQPVFTHETISYDYAHPQERVFATLYIGHDGKPRLYLLTQTQDAFVITANYRRPAREQPGRYFSGALEGFSAARILRAHQRRVAVLGEPVGPFDLEGRLAVAKAWFGGPGRAEVRHQNLHGLLWTVGTLGMVGAAVFGRR